MQAEYARIQNAEPGQLNVKHLIDRQSFFVNGYCPDRLDSYGGAPKAIAAFSDKYQAHERVDTMHFQVAGSHFGLNLPEGRYDLLVFADIDGNGSFESGEVIGRKVIELNRSLVPDMVLGQVEVQLDGPVPIDWEVSFDVPDTNGRAESLFYPAGSIRGLDDPIFDRSFSTLGMYDPASFMEQAPTMFYALEEDLGYKVPVVFVHGIGGSAREFAPLVSRLDRARYKPWFFHYPSGGDLDQLAELFYQIYFSGEIYRANGIPIVIVAHSMGGLVVREAINKYKGKANENEVRLFISLATPFGGHAAAAAGEEHGLIVLPSWRDLNPHNAFITNLYRKPLPGFVHHELIYAYQNPGVIKLGENSDGVVALTSQLYPEAQRQADGQFGFDNTHTDILESGELAEYILALIETQKSTFPADHLALFDEGGYDVELGDDYSDMTKYMIHTMGKYTMALTNGEIQPVDPLQEDFLKVISGDRPARTDIEKGWLLFLDEYSELGAGD